MLLAESGYCHRVRLGRRARGGVMIGAATWQALAAAGLGAAGGGIGGLFGIGGGVLIIPILGMLYGLDQQVAQGTVLVMVVPNVLFCSRSGNTVGGSASTCGLLRRSACRRSP